MKRFSLHFFRRPRNSAGWLVALWASLLTTLWADVTISSPGPNYQGQPAIINVNAVVDPGTYYSESGYDSFGNGYSWGWGRVGAIELWVPLFDIEETWVAAPDGAAAVPYSVPLPAGDYTVYAKVNLLCWCDGYEVDGGYYDENGDWVVEGRQSVAPSLWYGGSMMESSGAPLAISAGGSLPQTIVCPVPPPSVWAWNRSTPFTFAATSASGAPVRFRLLPNGPWGFWMTGDTLYSHGISSLIQSIGSVLAINAEVPASATHAYHSTVFYVTLDKITPPALTSVVVANSIYPWDYLFLRGVLGGTEMLDTAIISGGRTVNAYGQYNPQGYVGTTVISVRVAGSVTHHPSNWVTVTIISAAPTSPPVFTLQPVAQAVFAGAEVTFGAVATGAPVPTLQWRKNGVAIPGANGTTLVFSAAQSADSGSYDVVASNSAGVVPSQAATLTVTMPPPTIEGHPVSQDAIVGDTVTFAVAASGNPAPTYQWRKNGGALAGATQASLTIASVQNGDAGAYSLVVANQHGTITSVAASLTVSPIPPTIVTSATAVTAAVGAPFVYDFTYARPEPTLHSFVWDAGALPAGLNWTGPLYAGAGRISGTPTLPGIYPVTIRAWNASLAGAGPQFTVVITVTTSSGVSLPTITDQPLGKSVAVGQPVYLSVAASGASTYQWYKDGVELPIHRIPLMIVFAAAAVDVGSYTVVVSNSAGSVTSSPATLSVLGLGGVPLAGLPVITRQPQSQGVRPGGNIVLFVDGTSALPLSFQWRKAGVALAGHTNADLAVLGFSATDADFYDVIVANATGSVTSDAAALSLDQYAQEIRFLPLPNRAFPVFDARTTITLKAVATSLLPVTFSVVSGPATVAGNILTVTGAGLITVRAHQAGAQNGATGTYSPASLDREFTVVQGTPPPPLGATVAASRVDPKRGRAMAAITAAPPRPLWRDLDGDGIAEEITPAGVNDFAVSFDVQQLIDLAFGWELQAEQYRWVPVFLGEYFDPNAVNESGGFGATVRDFDFVQVPDFSAAVYIVVEDPTVDIFYTFLVHPDYEYFLFGEFNHRYGDNIERWPTTVINPATRHTTAETGGVSAHLTIADFGQPLVFGSSPYYVIRKGLAPGGCVLTLPGMDALQANKTNGTVTLGNGTTITAGPAGATVTIPGAGTVTIGTNGNVTTTLGGNALPSGVAHTTGVPSIALPGGITVNPGTGEVTVAGTAGASVTVGGPGGLRVALPPGLASIAGIIGRAVDTVGKILGIGTDPNKTKVDNGDGTGTWRDLDDPALNAPSGPQPVRVGVTDADSRAPKQENIFTITFTAPLQPLPVPKLAVDANRDGAITFDAADGTAGGAPYRFWLNDDDDGNALNNETEVEGSTNSDYASRGDFGIASKRDLEDFARLWISSAGIADALKSGALQIGLQWKADTVTGSPAINLYRHYEANGGTGYLTDNAVAIQQTTPPYSTTLVDAGNKNVLSSTNGVFVLKKEFFANLSSSQTKTHLLFEGAGVGKGMLQLLLLDQSGAQIGEGSGVWLDIRRINTMFERVKATTQYALSSGGIDATMPLPHDYIDPAQVPQPTMGWTADDRGEAFVPDPSEDLQNKNYIVFVHGWRQAPGQGLVGVSSALTYARTMYKRLWHVGYKGRFVAFRWPTFYGGSEAVDDDPLRGYTTYNDSEYRAWKAGQSLAQYVNQLPSAYKRRITAHSMGNIVAGSAFKYGMTADSYALLNAAVPALCYEETALRRWPTFTGIYGWLTSQAGYSIPSQSPNAPDSRTPVDDASPAIRALSYVRQLDAISADVVNFYLEADFATSISWNANNVIMRPHTVTLGRRYGYGWGDTDPGERLTLRDFPDQMIHRHPSDPHEVMAYDCKVPTFTVNATGGTGGSIDRTVNMETFGFDREHSAQWQWRFQQTAQFYQRLLSEFGLTPTL